MPKFDFKKEFKELYRPSAKQCSIVNVPEFSFLMFDGKGDPNTARAFNDGIEALYGAAYAGKFIIKGENIEKDYVVPPLEGLWWTDDMNDFSMDRKDIWKWTLMIAQPADFTDDIFQQAVDKAAKKKNPIGLNKIRLEKYNEGLSAQIMHVGPYSEEPPTIAKLHNFICENGYALTGKHHEIYLSDPRRCEPEKMKTIIRQPIQKKIGQKRKL